MDKNGKEVFINGTDKSDDLKIGHAWESLNTDLPPDPTTTPPSAPLS